MKRNANTGLTDHLGGKLHVGYMEVRNKLHAIRVRAKSCNGSRRISLFSCLFPFARVDKDVKNGDLF